ncbi:MAG: glucose-6-phosphate isomerase [Candidatus Eisenbacteria bacterium]|nr:glucose-6-phosphate isomerase [Candidatus Eisenbacteria bacterium]
MGSGTHAFAVTSALSRLDRPLADTLTGLQRDQAARRLWQHDPSLWTDDPAHVRVVTSRLGWLHVPDISAAALPGLGTLVGQLTSEGFRHALLLGMGGSSLCPEVLRSVFGVAPGHLDVQVLDNTSPESVRAAEAACDPSRTIFVVSSKSGTTVESASFQEYFLRRVGELGVSDPASRFLVITDPGTSLARQATERGFRGAFLNPPDIGGRYSALSLFGVVPAALLGLDLTAFLAHARAMAAACGPDVPAAENPGLYLGAALGMAARHGFDKLTFLPSPSLAPLGSWLEQLVAESTGKSGRGVVPVDGEPRAAASAYGPDRVFAAFSLEGEHRENEAFAAELAALGHPVLTWRLPEREALAAEFFRWEVATAVLGALLEVDPFDEPNVTESKDTTRVLLAEGAAGEGLVTLLATPSMVLQAGPKYSPRLGAAVRATGRDAGSPAAWLAAHLESVHESDYLALCAYIHRTGGREARLQGIRSRLGAAHAVTLGYGPRFLHSTGQLHKGGPDTGVFLQFTAEDGAELAIPGSAFGFRALRDAQALGDLLVLDRRGRRALRVHLPQGPDAGLEAVTAELSRALELAGPLRPAVRRTLP